MEKDTVVEAQENCLLGNSPDGGITDKIEIDAIESEDIKIGDDGIGNNNNIKTENNSETPAIENDKNIGGLNTITQTQDRQINKDSGADLSPKGLRKSIISFAWPCLLELMLVSLLNIVNLIMVGRLGAYAIAAVGITNQPVFISIAVFQSFNIGATALVARFIGAKDHASAKLVVVQALIISVFSGVLLCIIGYTFAQPIVVAMGAKSDTVIPATIYMKYMSVGMIFQAIPFAVSSLLRGSGETKAPMRYNIVSNIVNFVVSLFLIYGIWFFPALGVEGAAIASTIAKLTACVISLYILFTKPLPIKLTKTDKIRLDFSLIKRVMAIGTAAAGEQLVLRIGLLTFTKLVADLGTAPFAAHQIAINIQGLSFNVGQAFGLTATSFMGRNLGAKRPDLAQAYGYEARRMGFYISIFISVCFFFLGDQIASLYTNDNLVIKATAGVLVISAFIIPPQTSQLVIAGGLRGAGDTVWPLIATMSGILGVRLVLGFLFIRVFGWGLSGAWFANLADQYVRSIVIYLRFKSGKWKSIKV